MTAVACCVRVRATNELIGAICVPAQPTFALLSRRTTMAGRSTLEQVRAVTGTVRPPGTHGCKLVEVVPGLFTAHFHDFKEVRRTRLHDPGTLCTRDLSGLVPIGACKPTLMVTTQAKPCMHASTPCDPAA